MHANHAASRSPRPPADIPVRSSRGTASGPGSSSVRFPQGASPSRGGFQLDPQNWTANHFLRTENVVSNFTPMPADTPGQVAHGDHAIVGYAISPSMDDPLRKSARHSGMLLPVDFATDDGMLGVMDRVDT